MSALKLGDVTIERVVEIGRSTFPTTMMLPESTPEAIAAHHDWLKPYFFDEAVGDLGSRIQTYVIRTPRRTILVDTGVGNDKSREGNPVWHQRRGTYLDDLAALGVTPERVDLVVCTHMHIDHVGWNTRLVGGRWVPTFPNARYVFCGAEWEFWRHENEAGRDEYGCIGDSVAPIVEAGLARLVQPSESLDEGLRFEPTPGHTPGHVLLRLATRDGSAVFSGDLMHRTVQVAEPQWNSRFCYDGPRARATRQAFVEQHTDTGTLILASHFPIPGYIVTERGRRRFEPAAAA
ncbi:MAG TPA: MBL fold metallo-hydrolase [Methylomirabilota bacterium]|jgi:glyoxylase-like metal-dependent hydrolase (beta-lactamase superfamily II)|nr:MBL fold metallo-hydrolase [Methylomirabilota bacterium]